MANAQLYVNHDIHESLFRKGEKLLGDDGIQFRGLGWVWQKRGNLI